MAVQFSENTRTMNTTEWSLPGNLASPQTETDIGQVQLFLDVALMAAGDEFIIQVYEKARTADTQRLVASWTLNGTQADALFITPAITMARGWDITVTKVAGTDRAMPWSVRRWPGT